MSVNFDKLVAIMNRLRDDNGCPWDREQTSESLKPFLIEEAYEVLEAIEENDEKKVKEELGDLFYQILFHSKIADEKGLFDIEDVINTCSEKMIRRHPHVFGETQLKDSKEVLTHWEVIKKEEKKDRLSIFDGIPKVLPSLLKALQVQSRASRVGFDWQNNIDVLKKIKEEVAELEEALNKKERNSIEDELGDLFFSLVNMTRTLKMNPEDLLNKATSKFIKRFKYIESEVTASGKDWKSFSLIDLDEMWESAKEME